MARDDDDSGECSAVQCSGVACEGDDSDSSNADTAVPISCSAIVIVTVDSDSRAAEGGSGAVHFFFTSHFFSIVAPC